MKNKPQVSGINNWVDKQSPLLKEEVQDKDQLLGTKEVKLETEGVRNTFKACRGSCQRGARYLGLEPKREAWAGRTRNEDPFKSYQLI